MMQPQGLGALMPQGAQQAPQMNNPRLNAAVDVVSSDAEKQILDPRTLAMLKYKDALQAMQAADQMMAAAQPQPMPPTVAERTKLAAEQGIAGLASRLSPGIQRQGGNMQAQQMQQAMSGGLPQLSAPNMAGMAGGGIVSFDQGGGVEGDNFGSMVSDMTQRVAERRALRDREAEEIAYIQAVNRAIAAGEVPPERPVSLQPQSDPAVAALPLELMDVEPKVNVLSNQATAQQDTEEQVVYDASGRPTLQRYAQQPAQNTSPQAVSPEQVAAAESAARRRALAERIENNPFEAEARSFRRQQEEEMAALDPDAAATRRAARLKELTGADDLVAQRAEAERSRRELAETRFSPEAQRRRALRAGLAGLAERGLGGFSAGAGAEDERIYAEQAAESERSVAEMDRMIAELRAMGLSQFEAENTARSAVEGRRDTLGGNIAQLLESEAGAFDAATGRGISLENIDAQLEAARINASDRGQESQFTQVTSILTEKAKRDNPEITDAEAKLIGLQGFYAYEQSIASGRLGLQGAESDFSKIQAVENYMLEYAKAQALKGVPIRERDADMAAERRRIEALYGINQGTATPTGNSSTTGRFAVERIN
jgi:hypothetical protein